MEVVANTEGNSVQGRSVNECGMTGLPDLAVAGSHLPDIVWGYMSAE